MLNNVDQLQSKLTKQKKLENTCLQQEKVIEKLEKVVAVYKKKAKEKPQPGWYHTLFFVCARIGSLSLIGAYIFDIAT